MTEDCCSEFSCVLTWNASTPLGHSPLLASHSLPESLAARAFAQIGDYCYVLDAAGRLWERLLRGSEDRYQVTVFRPLKSEKIAGIACNEIAAVAWTTHGRVWAWGTDADNSGILGVKEVQNSPSPVAVTALAGTKVSCVAVGRTHCAAVDGTLYLDLGKLYAWGSGEYGQLGTTRLQEKQKLPQAVDTAKLFKCKKVACGSTFTAVCTTGGYVYLFGVMGSHSHTHSSLLSQLVHNQSLSTRGISSPRRQGHENRPYTFPDISTVFAVAISPGDGFLAILSDDGIPLIADDCLELVKLPTLAKDTVNAVSAVGRCVFGSSNSRFYEWREPLLTANAAKILRELVAQGPYACPLNTWEASVFGWREDAGSTVENTSVGSGSAAVFVKRVTEKYPFEPLGTASPKGRDQFVLSVLESSRSSLSHSRASVDDLSDIPATHSQDLYRALSQRLKAEQTTRIMCVHSFILERVGTAFGKIRKSAKERKLSGKRKTTTPTVMVNTLFRLRVSRIASAWAALKQHISLSALRQLTLEHEQRFSRLYRDEAAKSLLRSLAKVRTSALRAHAGKLFADHRRSVSRQRVTLAAVQVLRRYSQKSAKLLQRSALRQWNNHVIRAHISGKGVERLVAALQKRLFSTALRSIKSHCGRMSHRGLKLLQVLRHSATKLRQLQLLKSFSCWKALILDYRMSRVRHCEAFHTSCKVLIGRLKIVIKRKVYRSVWTTLRVFAEAKSRESSSNRLQTMCLITVISKLRFRYLSAAMNSIIRYQKWEKCGLGVERLMRLVRGRVRAGLKAVGNYANSQAAQRAFRLGIALTKAGERLKRVAMRRGFDLIQDKTSPHSTLSSPVLFGPRSASLHLPSALLSSLTSKLSLSDWSVLSDRKDYYCPEDSAGFLSQRDADLGEDWSGPAELEVSPERKDERKPGVAVSLPISPSKVPSTPQSPRDSLSTRAKDQLSMSMKGTKSLRSRRIQYTQDLKRRQQEINQRKVQRTVTEKKREENALTFEEFAENGARVSSSTASGSTGHTAKPELPQTLRHLVHAVLSSVVQKLKEMTAGGTEPDAALEQSWKFRLQRVGVERLRRGLCRHCKRLFWVELLRTATSYNV